MASHWLLVLIAVAISSCEDPATNLVPRGIDPIIPGPNDFVEITMQCVDMVSMGGTLQTVVNSELQYNQLIDDRFTRPLQDYWNLHYQTYLEHVRIRYPGLSQSEYERLVRETFYSTLPFRGTDTCLTPEIDFENFTLLGQDVHAGGCRIPDYEIEITRDDFTRSVLYSVRITEHGNCSMVTFANKWVLIRRIPDDYTVTFEREYLQE